MSAAHSEPLAKNRSSALTGTFGEVRLQLEEAGRLLIQPAPAALETCENLLSSALARLESTRPFWSDTAGNLAAAAEARSLRNALELARRLLENAANFYARWRGITQDSTLTYRADGRAQPIRQPVRILVSG